MIIPSDIQHTLTQAFILTASGHNEKIRQGTQMLTVLRQDILYPKVLLDYFSSSVDLSSALRAAIEFKLWFQAYKSMADFEYNIVAQTIEIVKSQIIHVYLQAQQKIAHMVQDAILAIAFRDFPINWQNLMPQLVPVLDITIYTPEQTLRVLKLFRKMFVKYEYSSRSDALYIEIIHVCDLSHDALLKLTTYVLSNLQTQQGDQIIQYKILKSLLRVFYYLNFQDLHPMFEDNLQVWMKILQSVLQLQATSYPNETFKCKGEGLRAVLLYSTKYREDFESLIQVFSQEIWAVCVNSNNDPTFDKIVHNALRYFKSLVAWQDMKAFFQSNMQQLMENLIIKNMQISKNDQFNFEEEPQTFIEAYFENSDLESRRAQTIELFKSLGKYYKDQVTQILTQSIQQHISNQNQIDFQNEILQINLVIDGLVVAYTSKDGAIDIQLDPQIPLTFYDQVIKKRMGDLYQLGQQQQPLDDSVPALVLAFYCRFIFVYRNFIPKNEILSITQVVSKMALAKHPTLVKIACYTVEALLTIKQGDLKTYQNLSPLFTRDNIGDNANQLLGDVYECAKSQLEQYSLRCISVILSLMKEKALSSVDALSTMFVNQLSLINEGFDFQNALLVFECMGSFLLSTLQVNDTQVALKFSSKLLPTLDQMLRENKGDISAFVLQIYSLLVLTIDPNNKQHEEYFGSIFKSFLVLENWQETNQVLFPAYILYFEGWLKNRSLQQPELQALQNILTQIIQYGGSSFTNLSEMLLQLPQGQQWIPFVLTQIFKQYQINLDQMQNQQTPEFFSKSKMGSVQKRMINKEAFLTLSNISMRFGVGTLIEECNKLTRGLLENFLINEVIIVKSIQNRLEKRQIFVMLTQLLFESQMQLSLQSWQIVFKSMIDNFTGKRKIPLFMQMRLDHQITSSSGFQKLQALQQIKEKQQPLIDEEKYFGQRFKLFYQNPDIQQQINIPSLIDQQQQEILTQIIQNV